MVKISTEKLSKYNFEIYDVEDKEDCVLCFKIILHDFSKLIEVKYSYGEDNEIKMNLYIRHKKYLSDEWCSGEIYLFYDHNLNDFDVEIDSLAFLFIGSWEMYEYDSLTEFEKCSLSVEEKQYWINIILLGVMISTETYLENKTNAILDEIRTFDFL